MHIGRKDLGRHEQPRRQGAALARYAHSDAATHQQPGAGVTDLSVPLIQRLTIRGWHPPNVMNGSQTNRYTRQARKKQAEMIVWASAKQEGWQKVTGRARLTVTLVYARPYRMDTDNLYARLKPCCDALKGDFIVDDSREWLDLVANVAVRPGAEKATELLLEAVD